jgi:Ion channel
VAATEAQIAEEATRKHASRRKKMPFLYLLITELALIVVFPLTVGSGVEAHFFRLLTTTLFAVSLYTALGNRRITMVALLLGVPPVTIYIANTLGSVPRLHLLGIGLGSLYLIFMTAVFIHEVLSHPAVTTDTLYGAIAAFLLVGFTCGMIYAVIQQVSPGSFLDTVEPSRGIRPPELIFFSFTTLTTVGYGDIVPRHGFAKSIAVLESLMGVMYPAVFVGRLIGLHAATRRSA